MTRSAAATLTRRLGKSFAASLKDGWTIFSTTSDGPTDRDSAWELANDEPECSQGPQSDLDWSRLDEPPYPLEQSARRNHFYGGLDYSCLEDESLEEDDIPF